MPKRRTDSTPKPTPKRKKSSAMTVHSSTPSVAAAIDYDLLAAAIIKQSQNSTNSNSASNVCDNNSVNSAEVNNDITWDLCDNTAVNDSVNSTVVPVSEVSIQPSSSNVIPKPATSTSSSESQDITDSSTNVANLVNALLQQNSEGVRIWIVGSSIIYH
ncbi:uncharacterized protein LOC134243815 isoform X2 [Saccostrea cucullata]|uniref:uncharacterized protein LOC134243815 isoform X2 n=1 Tax=Saccostrea cuccullata TaxID=36930 RepID=UPI002ED39BDE